MWKFAVTVVVLLAACTNAQEREEDSNVVGGYSNQIEDPCARKYCGPGKECDLTEEGKPICICAHSCPEEEDSRAKVCSTQNVTFDSECHLYREKCICHRKGAACRDWRDKHAHLDYFGECREIPVCEGEDLTEYPSRMRQWLYRVMEELAKRRDLNDNAMELVEKNREHSKKWVIPVIWKFCDLDKSRDRLISMEELLPISAPLKALEHCTGSFLRQCDPDGDGEITLDEWGQCLGLQEDEIEDLCDSIY